MCNLHHFLGIDVMFLSPEAPLTSDGAGGVHKNSVEVEEDGGAIEYFHAGLFATFAAFGKLRG